MQFHTFQYLDRNGNGWTRHLRAETIGDALAELKADPDVRSVRSWTVRPEGSLKPAVLWSEIMWPLRLSR